MTRTANEPEVEDTPVGSLADWLVDLVVRGLLAIARTLPYDSRVPFMGWVTSRLIAPIAGYRRRAVSHLAMTHPAMSRAERYRIANGVADNFGRTLAEIYSGQEFASRVAASNPLSGAGLSALLSAASEGRPVILAVAHFGNYDAMRSALVAKGIEVGAVYRPMDNPYFNAHYTQAIHKIAEPLFPRTRTGIVEMVRFLRKGGVLALGVDQHYASGESLMFFGLPAMTTLSPATFALKYGCDLIPIHAIRRPNGLDFDVRVDAPIAHSTPVEMMQAVNDNLESVVRDHMDQWFWIHRRWKPHRRQRATATSPQP
jgi:KDO2-lipid IV(A) lauroyltransferase